MLKQGVKFFIRTQANPRSLVSSSRRGFSHFVRLNEHNVSPNDMILKSNWFDRNSEKKCWLKFMRQTNWSKRRVYIFIT